MNKNVPKNLNDGYGCFIIAPYIDGNDKKFQLSIFYRSRKIMYPPKRLRHTDISYYRVASDKVSS